MIGQKAALGGATMVAARFMTRLIDLGTLLVLARILRPTDFGLVAIAMSLILIAETALELPVNQALMRLPTISNGHYGTAFTLGILRGLALTLILLLAAWPFARLYGDPRLVALIFVLSISSISRGCTSPRLAEFQKSMSFWRDFAMELGGKGAGFSVSVSVALLTGSYWAIAAGTVTTPVAIVIISFVLAPWRPSLTLSEMPSFTGFLGWTTAAQIVSAFNFQFERLILGKLQTRAQLGLFTTSNDIAIMPFMALFGPILRPLLAAFALLTAEPARLARSYLAASSAVVTLGLPLLVGESLVAEPAVRLVLGPQWGHAAPLLRWLALSMIPALLAMPASPLFMAFGKTRILFLRNTLEFSIKGPIALIGALHYGFFGIIVARFVSELAAGLFCMVFIKASLQVGILGQLRGSVRSVVATLAMIAPVVLCTRAFANTQGAGGAALSLASAGAVGAATYATVLLALWRNAGSPAGVEAMGATAFGRVRRRIWRETVPL